MLDTWKATEYAAVAVALAGSALVAHRRVGGFYCWLAANVVMVFVVSRKGLDGLAVQYVVFAVLCVYSIWQWKRP